MRNECLTCTAWAPKRAAKMANHGFGCCSAHPAWVFFSPAHTCAKHKPAKEAVTAARTVWLAKMGVAA